MVGIASLRLSSNPRSCCSFGIGVSPSRSALRSCVLPRTRPASRFPRIYALSSNDIKVGVTMEIDGTPYKVLEFLHVKPGKGAAFVRTKIRNYLTGNVVEKTFRAGVSLNEANVSKEMKQYSYKDGSQYVFMDMNSYEECRISEVEMGDRQKWLKEGMDCFVYFWNGKVIDCELPLTVKLTIAETDSGGKGESAQGATKLATLETGAVISVPVFANTGDEVLVDTRTGQYTGRG